MIRALTVGVAAVLVVSATAAAPPRVYVFTAEPKASPPTEDEQGRLDSVRDLIEALRHNSKIAIAPSAAESDVQV